MKDAISTSPVLGKGIMRKTATSGFALPQIEKNDAAYCGRLYYPDQAASCIAANALW